MHWPTVAGWQRSQASRTGCQQPQSGFWSRFAQGSLGRALWFAQQDWYQAKISLVNRLAQLSEPDTVELAELLIDLAKSYAAQARKQDTAVSDTVAKQRIYSFLLGVISSFYRDLMLCISGANKADWINYDQESAIKQASKTLSLLQASRAVTLVGRAEYLIARNVNATLVFEDLFGDLAKISRKLAVA